MNMIAAYDIADAKRLRRVAGIMKDYGVRVQKSIFELSLTPPAFRDLKQRIANTIDHGEDGVKFFPLCEKCAGAVEIIGQGIFVDPDEEFYIF